jgi:hypothetical protein
MLDDPVYQRIASLSRLVSSAVTVFIEGQNPRPEDTIGVVLSSLEKTVALVEADFVRKRLGGLDSNETIGKSNLKFFNCIIQSV